jgi:acyl-CoA synthetase (AMP-forming)/AMP-acid ligase II
VPPSCAYRGVTGAMLRLSQDGWALPDIEARRRRHFADGSWSTTRLADFVARRLSDDPHKVAVIDNTLHLTRAELHDRALRLGSALVRRGLKPGAVVSFQLPNWHEACVINLACALYGFVLNPLLPMYRERDLEFILAAMRSEVLFIPTTYRNLDYEDLIGRVDYPTKRQDLIFCVRGEGNNASSYEALLAEDGEIVAPCPADNADVKLVIFTSGSTGRPKGVIHSHHTLHATVEQGCAFWDVGADDRLFVPSPIGHIGGSIYAFEMPWLIGCTAILMEHWEPNLAVEMIDAEGGTFLAGATPFLQGLLDAAVAKGSHLPSLRRYVCGGASVPVSLIERAQARFPSAVISRAFGSSEVPIICPGIRTQADARWGQITDGEIEAEVRIVDTSGEPVEPGTPGEILARTARMFVGYLESDDEVGQFTDDGYFVMGDIGVVVEERFLEITGRRKEIIIRHGENISPREIENALLSSDVVANAVVVGVPDARTGERAVAFVVLKPGAVMTIDSMRSFLTDFGMAKQKFPEELHIRDSFPMNSIGKVLKEELKAGLAAANTKQAAREVTT